jgi:phage baseplate assembly protein V
MSRIRGVIVGKVVDVNDENGEGRIRVNFPWMKGNTQTYWAPVATLMSGGTRGSWFMPEVGDEVLVAFDRGDSAHPYVVGFLWNGKEKPPETNTHKRLIKSVKKHTILLDDTDGSEKIELTTGGGLKITMDDTSKTITIQASQKVEVKAKEVAVEGETNVSVKAQAISVEAAGNASVKAQAVSVEATEVAVKAGQISLGEGASHPAVWGDVLFDYLEALYTALQAHVHPGQLAAGILPVTPSPPSPLPPVPTIISTTVVEA